MNGMTRTNSISLSRKPFRENKTDNMNMIFQKLIDQIDTEDINEILFNWNESELNADGTEILIYVDSRSDGPRTGGADKVDKKEFIDWLVSDAPFDPSVYGKDILEDEHWIGLIGKARQLISIK